MQNSKIRFASTVLMATLLFSAVYIALALDSDFGKIMVKTVSIMDGDVELSGLLYTPKSAVADGSAPAVVLAHGIGGSKEMMSSIGLELARRGFVTLCLDLFGHGQSQGTVEEGRIEPSFGVYAAIQYLKSQSFVNSSALGLIGHSLGARAARAAATQDNQIVALVLIAGGLGDVAEGPQYCAFNSTYPRNLLVVVGKYDILFDVGELTKKELPIAFGTQEVIPGVLYGSFSSQTARKLVVPNTTHLFEPTDSMVVSESLDWTEKAIGGAQTSDSNLDMGFVYPLREASIAVALVGLIGITFLSFFLIEKHVQAKSPGKLARTEKTSAGNWRLYVVWGVVNIALFAPMFVVGLIVSFPPLIFGSSVAWWMLCSGLTGLLLLAKFSESIVGKKIALKETLTSLPTVSGLITAIVVFVILFAAATIFAVVFSFNFRIITPILRDFSSATRLLAFFAFIPFFLVYFVAEGFYLHELNQWIPSSQGSWKKLRNFAVTVFGKIAPFILLLFLQYTVKIAFDFWLLPSFIGFLLEFIWLIIPIFAIASSFSWWFYKRTGNAFSGALFNALLMSWIASEVFPL